MAKINREDALAKLPYLAQALGKVISIQDVAAILNIDIRVIRCNPWRYGGIPGGAKKVVFYERTVENALLGFKNKDLDWPGQIGWEKEEKDGLQNEAGGREMGRSAAERFAQPADAYNLLA